MTSAQQDFSKTSNENFVSLVMLPRLPDIILALDRALAAAVNTRWQNCAVQALMAGSGTFRNLGVGPFTLTELQDEGLRAKCALHVAGLLQRICKQLQHWQSSLAHHVPSMKQ